MAMKANRVTVALVLCGALLMSACTINIDANTTEKTEDTETTVESSVTESEDTAETSAEDTTGAAPEVNMICAWKNYAINTLGIQDLVDLYTLDGDEDDIQVMFYPDGDITNFNLYTITNFEANDDGSYKYDKSMTLWEPSLQGNRGYLISIRIMGDLPEYGYSYEDQNGNTKMFLIEVSGEDGEIVTIPG